MQDRNKEELGLLCFWRGNLFSAHAKGGWEVRRASLRLCVLSWTLNTILSVLDWQEELGTKTSLLQDVTREGNIDRHISHSQKERGSVKEEQTYLSGSDMGADVIFRWCTMCNYQLRTVMWHLNRHSLDGGSLEHSGTRRCSGFYKRMAQNTSKIHSGHVTILWMSTSNYACGNEVTKAMAWLSGSSWGFYVMTTELLQMEFRALQKAWAMEEAVCTPSSKTPSSKRSSPLLHLVLTQAALLAWNSGYRSVTQFYSLLESITQ